MCGNCGSNNVHNDECLTCGPNARGGGIRI